MNDQLDLDADQLSRMSADLYATATDVGRVAAGLGAIDAEASGGGAAAQSARMLVRRARAELSQCASDLLGLENEVMRRARVLSNAENASPTKSWFVDLGALAIGALNGLADHLPTLPDIQLDPNGPIMRRARGEAVDPFAWSEELARYQAIFLLAFAPEQVRDGETTVDVPFAGAQSVSATAVLGSLLDVSNLIGGPAEERLLRVIAKVAPGMERPFLAALGRVLGREAPGSLEELTQALVQLLDRTGMSKRMAGQSLRHAIQSSEAIDALGGAVDYGGIDELGRPLGVKATIVDGMTGNAVGTPANDAIIPPGYSPQKPPLARGHLLGRQLGGSGDVFENLVALYQNDTNTPIMSRLEARVRGAVESGQKVEYEVTPIYEGRNPMPSRLHIRAHGTMADGAPGIEIDQIVENVPRRPASVDPMSLLVSDRDAP